MCPCVPGRLEAGRAMLREILSVPGAGAALLSVSLARSVLGYKELTDGSRSAATPKIDVGMEIMITLVTLVGCSIIILFIIFIMIWFCQAVSPKQSKHNVVTILLKICLDHNQEVVYCLDHLLQMR